ncbi:TfoX/Sxy family protein [Variovorax sp. HJSM1_2]|uniref:TfoX/Sxy family protein n=1 Tax=Variovorax sp. HJSM1_2 TaxID=3366263 RepID=UPI003BEE25FF
MSDFAEHLHEAFERFGRITLKRMFGGHGVFHEGRMFGLIAADRLYLKTDAQTVARFEAKQLPPFAYLRGGKLMATSYFEAPPEVFEDREEAASWARLAWEATLRSGTPPRAKPKPKPSAKPATARKKPSAA